MPIGQKHCRCDEKSCPAITPPIRESHTHKCNIIPGISGGVGDAFTIITTEHILLVKLKFRGGWRLGRREIEARVRCIKGGSF